MNRFGVFMKNCFKRCAVLGLLLLGASSTWVQAADPVTKVKIGSIHGQLRYDKVFFAVKPGAAVEITLVNTDEMLHNWVLCKTGEGVAKKVSDAAVALGEKAFELDLVPDLPEVIANTKLAYPNKTVTLKFKAPMTEADYPYICTVPGHALTMRGVMRVTKDPANAKVPAYLLVKPPSSLGRNYKLTKVTQPLVMRVTVQDTPSRSIAVGLPAGTHYMFDSVNGQVLYGWTGGYLDIGADRRGRGGGTCKILGEKFDVGAVGCPVRIGSPSKVGKVKFIGYRRLGTPQFAFEVDGIEVRQTVNAAEGGGLTYSYRLPKMTKDVYFVVKADKISLSSSAGAFKDGVLKIGKDQVTAFTVTVRPSKKVSLAN
jgi:azurin